ncbi:MAG: alpha/beta hydrolase [Lachnospiraceae bacterium]|nr:alpha/beta hydrolase [Lachnospiraceae bacterium]
MEMEYKGLRVEYLEAGEGPLVVLLHGWGSNKELYQSLINTLAVKYHVVAPDMPGAGKSEEPGEAWSVDDYCDFVEEFVSYFLTAAVGGNDPQNQQVILAGHSHGGRVLIKMLGGRELPFKVTKLILIDSAGLVPEKTKEQLKKMKRYKRGKKFLSLPVVKFFFPNALEKFQSKSGSADYRNATPIMRQTMVKVVNEDVREYLPRIKAETLLVWGDRDTATPLSDGKYMESQIPGSGLAVLPGGGHFSFLDNQHQFLAVMRSFLGI